MIKHLFIVLSFALAPSPALADADAFRDRLVRELRDDGYAEIRISRTLLGRMRFVAERPESRREIVVNPATGVILRDYIRWYVDAQDDGVGTSSELEEEEDEDEDDDDDEEEDDNDDEEDDDDEDDDDEDDDDSDNSGSGSSNSGSGSNN